ncbi:IS200/IS605 family element RNA-guided endonuclease TnpB [Methanobacterium sp. SMA-27]|uniref:IS200/IS605 family element RNA-guided endonuclease TnpB n=1 Tax=Methanobacterium sp. SMA-27 TaxID=1495336 RepID=UPI00064F6545|nr:IS200/IS605 family element RNA-guided endonuclease TnpB [Methanobacterium sp. SMA-27]
MFRAYKYRMYPKREQKDIFTKFFGAIRFVYNWGLEQKIRTYKENDKAISRFALNNELVTLKKENTWLNEVYSQSLQGATLNLEDAFKRFYRKQNDFPGFKSKKNRVQSFNVPQHYKVDFDNNMIRLPKIGWVKTKLHRTFKGKLKTATVSMTNTDKYYISILVDDGEEPPVKMGFSKGTTIGLDMGLTQFLTTSDGVKVDNPRPLKQQLKRLKCEQRKLSRKERGSNNWNKQKLKISKIHERICNVREDFQHKLSKSIVCENQVIAIEKLNIKGMIRNHYLAQSISDVGWSSFMKKLKYKCEWYGKTLLQLGLFEPSTKICSNCGYHNNGIKLHQREWICPNCEKRHDRDINAAVNIRDFALDKQNLISTVGTTEIKLL